jgi:hypothetical protein
MSETPTTEQVVDAARSIGGEFTRDDVAEKLGIERSEMKPSWKAAKDAGQIEKVRSDADGQNYFRVAAT